MKRSTDQNHFTLKKTTISRIDNLSLKSVKGGWQSELSLGGSSCVYPTVTKAATDPFVQNNI